MQYGLKSLRDSFKSFEVCSKKIERRPGGQARA